MSTTTAADSLANVLAELEAEREEAIARLDETIADVRGVIAKLNGNAPTQPATAPAPERTINTSRSVKAAEHDRDLLFYLVEAGRARVDDVMLDRPRLFNSKGAVYASFQRLVSKGLAVRRGTGSTPWEPSARGRTLVERAAPKAEPQAQPEPEPEVEKPKAQPERKRKRKRAKPKKPGEYQRAILEVVSENDPIRQERLYEEMEKRGFWRSAVRKHMIALEERGTLFSTKPDNRTKLITLRNPHHTPHATVRPGWEHTSDPQGDVRPEYRN